VAGTAAGALRRLAAAAYDGLLLLAVLMVVTALAQLYTHGEAISPARHGAFAYLYRALLAACIAAYFGVAWTRHGQTLGMKAWRLRLEAVGGARLAWPAAVRRLAISGPIHLLAIAGALLFIAHRSGGWLLAACVLPCACAYLVRGDGSTLVDRLSGTRVARTPVG
jgi:uncharacterized RDD family membrane protein YckC